MHSWNIFGAWTSQGHTWTYKIHQGPDLGQATTFPLIVLYVINHKGCIQMLIFSGLPNLESQNSLNWDSHHFGGS
jgi:hypothetical protein